MIKSGNLNVWLEICTPVPMRKNILIVDDDADIREIMTFILEAAGYNVANLDGGKQVMAAIAQNRPDLVLLDIQLGDSDGRDICRQLKDQTATQAIPVIMISANHNPQSLLDKNCRAEDFLAKPFDIDELIAHVHRFAA